MICVNHTNALHSGNLQVSTTGADAIDINSYSTNANSGGRLSFYRSKNASIGSNTIVADDDSLGRIDFRGYNTSGNSYNQGATIEARVDGSVNSSTDMPTAILFKTSNDGSASPDERLRIDSDGRVGIGTNNPEHQLDGASDLVIGNQGEADSGMTFVSATNGQSLIHFSDALSGNARYDGFIGYEHTDRFLKFGTAQGVRMVIKGTSGRVGINSTDPRGNLDVVEVGTAATIL